jgi:major membrane immunogen (membrane-anchored lipoprotein)
MKKLKKVKGISTVALVLTALILMTVALASCGAKDVRYQDGTFVGQSSADEDGAFGEVTIVVTDGEISACDYVTWQKDGTIKDENYGKVNGEIDNQDFYDKAQLAVAAMRQYADELATKKRADEVDAVSGATISYDQFREAVDAALKGQELKES